MDIGIVGTWNSDMNDTSTKNNIGNATMTFTNDGRLIYDIREGNKLQRMTMTYQISGDFIISDQSSQQSEQKTKYKLLDNNNLVLEFDGIKTLFKREVIE